MESEHSQKEEQEQIQQEDAQNYKLGPQHIRNHKKKEDFDEEIDAQVGETKQSDIPKEVLQQQKNNFFSGLKGDPKAINRKGSTEMAQIKEKEQTDADLQEEQSKLQNFLDKYKKNKKRAAKNNEELKKQIEIADQKIEEKKTFEKKNYLTQKLPALLNPKQLEKMKKQQEEKEKLDSQFKVIEQNKEEEYFNYQDQNDYKKTESDSESEEEPQQQQEEPKKEEEQIGVIGDTENNEQVQQQQEEKQENEINLQKIDETNEEKLESSVNMSCQQLKGREQFEENVDVSEKDKENLTNMMTTQQQLQMNYSKQDMEEEVIVDGEGDVEVKKSTRISCLTFFIIAIPILLLLGGVGYIYYLKEEAPLLSTSLCNGKNRDYNMNCNCKDKYFQKGNEKDCVGPFDNDFYSEEDMQISLQGQETNFVTRVFKKNAIEEYVYDIENVQKNTLEDVTTTNVTKITHNINVVTLNITEKAIQILMYVANSTVVQDNQSMFIEGYPNNLSQQNDGEDNNNQENHQEQPLNEWEEKVIKDANISKETFEFSQMPLLRVNMTKQGNILGLQYPINIRSDFKDILSNVLNQYSPPLHHTYYTTILDNSGQEEDQRRNLRRRVLQENENPQKLYQRGYFQENEDPEFEAEIDEIYNKANVFKNYNISSENEKGVTVEQSSSFQQKTKIEGGTVKESVISSTMDIINPGKQDEFDDISPDVQDGQETTVLMDSMKIEQFASFKLKGQQSILESFSLKAIENLNLNHLKNVTFQEFQDEIIEEKKFMNELFEQNSNLNLTMSLKDEEIDDMEEEDLNKNLRRILEEENTIIKKIKFKIFKFKVLGIDVKAFSEFWCNEGPQGSKKDVCYLAPTFHLGKHKIEAEPMKYKVTLLKMVKQYNWYRRQILDRVNAVQRVLKESMDHVKGNITEVIDASKKIVNIKENGLFEDLKQTKKSVRHLISISYAELKKKLDIILKNLKNEFLAPIETLKQDILSFALSYFNNMDIFWENMNGTHGGNLDLVLQLLKATEKTSELTCGIIKNSKEELVDFIEDYLHVSKDMVNQMADVKIFQPMYKFFGNLQYQLEESEDLRKNQYVKIANAMISTVLQYGLHELMEYMKDSFEVYSTQMLDKVLESAGVLNPKYDALVELCEARIEPGFEQGVDFLEDLQQLMSLQEYTQDDLVQPNPDLDFLPDWAVKLENLRFFQDLVQKKHELFDMVLSTLLEFDSGFREDFISSTNNVIRNVTNIAINLRENIIETKQTIMDGVQDIIGVGTDLIPKLQEAILYGNQENQEYEEPVYEDTIRYETEAISDLQGDVDETSAIIDSSKTMPEQYAPIKEEVHENSKDMFSHHKDETLQLAESEAFDEEDMHMAIMVEMHEEQEAQVYQVVEEQVDQQVEAEQVNTFNANMTDTQDTLLDRLKEEIFNPVSLFDGLFKDTLDKILDMFKMEKDVYLKKQLIDISLDKTFYYPTPIGIPLYLSFGVNAKAGVEVDLKIQGKIIDFEATLDVNSSGEAQGGVSIWIAKVGAFVEAQFYTGVIVATLYMTFATALQGKIQVLADFYPYRILTGIFAQYRKITFRKKCFWKLCIPIPKFVWRPKKYILGPYEIAGKKKKIYLYDKNL